MKINQLELYRIMLKAVDKKTISHIKKTDKIIRRGLEENKSDKSKNSMFTVSKEEFAFLKSF